MIPNGSQLVVSEEPKFEECKEQAPGMEQRELIDELDWVVEGQEDDHHCSMCRIGVLRLLDFFAV